jgi:hypothetical protein
MENIKIEEGKGVLVIRIDMTKEGKLSASGKSKVIASTQGNVAVGAGMYLGVNLYRKV